MEEKLLVFASGDEEGGGSGFQELAENSMAGILQARIVAVVSNHQNGGVAKKAKKLGIQLLHFPKPFTADAYQQIWHGFGQPWVALSGWLKLVSGLPMKMTVNIHPGPLPEFGGQDMYGHYVHEAVIKAFQEGKVKSSAVSIHFVNPEYDKGPIIFRYPVLIREDDTPKTIAARVNKIEHGWQSWVTNLVITRQIRLEEGKLVVPDWYHFHEPIPLI